MASDTSAEMIFSETVRSALVLAATRRPGTTLHTGPVLDALARTDYLGNWNRLWLHSGQPDQNGLALAADGDVPAAKASAETWRSWEGVPLSGSMGEAMRLLAELAERYSMRPVPPGALALALVAAPSSGAAQILLASGEVTLADVLSTIQSELLGTDLTGLDEVLAGYGSQARSGRSDDYEVAFAGLPAAEAAEALAGARQADDLDLVQVLLRDKAVASALARVGVDRPRFAEVAAIARMLGTRTADEVIEQAKADAGTDSPTDVQCVIAALTCPSRGLARALGVFGTSGAELAAAVGMTVSKRVTSESVLVSSVVNLVASFAVVGAIIAHAISSHALWELVLVVFAFVGPPSTGTVVSLVVAAALWLIAGPLVGSVKLAETVVSYWRSRAERRDILQATGVRLSERAHNLYVQRNRSYRAVVLRLRSAVLLDRRMDRLRRAVLKGAQRQQQAAGSA